MAAAAGPTQLLQVCGQRLDRFIQDAQRKRLAWLREAEEQGLRLLHSDFGAEPELMPKTPSQRRRPRKRPSACLRDGPREPSRRRPGEELSPASEKAPRAIPVPSRGAEAASPPAERSPPPEQQAGNSEGTPLSPNSEGQNKNREQTPCAKAQKNPSLVWVRSCKQAMGALWSGQQAGVQTLSPSDDKQMNSENRMPPSSSSASKVVRPLKTFLQAVQRNQLLTSPGPTGHGGVIKSLIKCSTPTRPNLKERERQRLESLRKKQEAEEQRRKKVEEEKRRRQAEMNQKREERLRKALQARERVEQMEEEKKKRMEQKILQNDEKAHISQVREEKVAEERSKKKLSKKQGEADAWKQKVLRAGEDEFEQQEPLQNRREDEGKEKGKKVLEPKNLVEQQQTEHMGESAVLQKSSSTSQLQPLKAMQGSRALTANKNNYGMDLRSDDSTDDENEPRKPVPAWAVGAQLQQAVSHQYHHPVNLQRLFGLVTSPKLENIFGKRKPRYFKRTSSAVWHSPPVPKCTRCPCCNFIK
ncbi:inner centromere protein A-like [Columba guinea]|nr:inner centromere protein A-like [Columba guinea]